MIRFTVWRTPTEWDLLIVCELIYFVLGNLENETDVLDWMIDQKSDESIEEIDRETLFEYIGSKDFLAVVFCELNMFGA